MNFFRYILLVVVAMILISGVQATSFFGFEGDVAYAQGTVLPERGYNCVEILKDFTVWTNATTEDIELGKQIGVVVDPYSYTDFDKVLGCAIVTGRVSLDMVPWIIRYMSNFLLGLVSLLALLFVVIGGVLTIVGGLSEQKEKGKAFIKNALMGMAIAFLAWSIVNVILSAITG